MSCACMVQLWQSVSHAAWAEATMSIPQCSSSPVHNWHCSLVKYCNPSVGMHPDGWQSICILALQAVIAMSSEQPLVHWLAPVPRTVTANYLATGVVQTALTGSINSVSSWGTNLAATHWYWNAGLQVGLQSLALHAISGRCVIMLSAKMPGKAVITFL